MNEQIESPPILISSTSEFANLNRRKQGLMQVNQLHLIKLPTQSLTNSTTQPIT